MVNTSILALSRSSYSVCSRAIL